MTHTGLQSVTVLHRDGTTALNDVTLDAEAAEFLVILGGSGSGKTTVLRAVAGLTEVHRGEVFIDGREVTGLIPQKRNVAMVFEDESLAPFLDVAKNMAWGLKARRVPQPEIEERVSGKARSLGLERLLARLPKTLSSGEKGLAGIGRAMVREPSVFLFDEPLAHLDVIERARTRRLIVELVRQLGVTTFYVTHDQADAMAIADRIALLHDGALVQLDTPRELYARPVNLLAAGFLGSPPIGLIPARLVRSGSAAAFEVGARTLPLWGPVPPELAGYLGQQVVLGLRPEDVHDPAEHYDPEHIPLAATVVTIEHTGPESVVTLAVDAPAVSAPGAASSGGATATIHAIFSRRTAVQPGQAVQVAIDLAQAHVFDSTTGEAIRHP